ncbi:hypothetical protein EDC96DRAFT_549871 [Choanephora cucurbitarum]|nr:hypothetical protein EDC96DRAFT_549871 [Choanephora cucurbitarum]
MTLTDLLSDVSQFAAEKRVYSFAGSLREILSLNNICYRKKTYGTNNKTFLTYEERFEEFSKLDDFISIDRVPTLIPEEASERWFTAPDMIWIAVSSFKATIVERVGNAYYTCKHKENKRPACVISFFSSVDHHQCYRYTELLTIEFVEHPSQSSFTDKPVI